ncbi:MAG: type II toxin-antitoxin system RelB/DinJ family antitoxin [Eubacteriaceae bacterium]|nr:type II toxin-antitoxin system RelB/DinJ family antitoxin [Eubacteriaceae bacterium]
MGQTDIHFQIDEALKRDFEELCSELGLTMSTAFIIFAKASLRKNGIPFPMELETPNSATLSALDEVRQQKANPDRKLYNSFSELLEDIEDGI